MPRITPKENTQQQFNIFKTMDVSPNFLQSFMGFKDNLGKDNLSPELREKIALTAAGVNNCRYCKAAHSAIAKKIGISEAGIEYALNGKCGDPKTDAALKFVTAILEKRGHISDEDFTKVKDAGYSDEEVIDIFGQAMINLITNYFNDFTRTDIDF